MIKIYTIPDCEFCEEAKKLLIDRNIDYEEFNLAAKQNRDARKFYRSLGARTAPVIVNDEEDWILTEYDKDDLIDLLEEIHG